MPDPTPDHDQRLKVLLKEFFDQFFACFFPDWAERFDFAGVEWLDKEVFLAPPQGEKRLLDLLAKLPLKPDVEPPRPGMKEMIVLVHVEVESRESAAALRDRMFEYFSQLRREFDVPILPIGLFLFMFRCIQAAWQIITGEREMMIAAHEAEDLVAENKDVLKD